MVDLAWTNNSEASDTVNVWDRQRVVPIASGYYINSLQWSDDGRLAWAASAGTKTRVLLWEGGNVRTIAEEPYAAFSLAWSRDGRLAWESMSLEKLPPTYVIRVWDGAAITDTLRGPTQFSQAWSDDGRLVGQSDRTISVWDGRSVVSWTPQPNQTFEKPIWWADGRLAWGGSDIFVWDGQQVTSMIHDPTAKYKYPLWLGARQAARP